MTRVREIALTVNGEVRRVTVDPDRMLSEVLRDDLDLTGAKKACENRARRRAHSVHRPSGHSGQRNQAEIPKK